MLKTDKINKNILDFLLVIEYLMNSTKAFQISNIFAANIVGLINATHFILVIYKKIRLFEYGLQ